MARLPLRDRQGEVVAYALVDSDVFEWASQRRWYRASHGYVRESATKRYLHRLIMDPADGLEVDHLNHDLLDCRRSNLRVVSKAVNGRNRKPRQYGSSRFPGVSRCSSGWRAYGWDGSRQQHLGIFASESAAARAATTFRERLAA